MDKIELRNGKTIERQSLTKEVYEDLLRNAEKRMDGFAGLKMEVDVLNDRRVLVEENGHYTIYYNLPDLQNVISDVKELENSSEMLLNKNSYGERFSEHVEELVRGLLSDLQMTDEKLDDSLLKKIDNKVRTLEHGGQSFNEDHLINYIALIGLMLTKYHGAVWQMEKADDGVTWNPYQVRNQEIQFFIYLYEDIFMNKVSADIVYEVYATMEDIIKYNLFRV
ncbi:hypothetical protein [Deminuibacter soli]|uniref:Uncharacterized protein n=1 Tax=Deminuibacter soli TaxID=2291815 RepID=A0A3E1NMM7_9BACT|nr:hypothetical protein [Deminuibacter soli]RFM29068.1 hypothetical protein DXN05_09935 [Deminuibacter soli]